MFGPKIFLPFLILALSFGLALPVFAVQYRPGVSPGQFVRYGNFVGTGPGYETFNDYGFLNLRVVSVSSSSVTLLSTGQFKNGTALPGNGTVDVWDVAGGTDNGIPSTQGPIVAANLNQGNLIPPPNTYAVNQTVDREYLGTTRSVNILDVTISTPDYNSTLDYVYDKASGMLLESTSMTVTQAQSQPITSTYSYSVVATNIFGSASPSPSIPEVNPSLLALSAAIFLVVTLAVVTLKKRSSRPNVFEK